MKKFLLIGIVVAFALSANAQLKRVSEVGATKRPELALSKQKNRLDPNHGVGVYNKDGVIVDGKKAPNRVINRDVYYNRPAGAFPNACVGNSAGERLGNFAITFYYMKPYNEYTFKSEVGELSSFPNLITMWESFYDPDEPELIMGEPEYYMYGIWGSSEDFPMFHAILGNSPEDPNAEWHSYQNRYYEFDYSKDPPRLKQEIPNCSYAVPSLDEYYSDYDYVFWWSQKAFTPGGKFGDEPYTIRLVGGLGGPGIDPNENIADTAKVHKGSWMGKNSGVWVTQDSIQWYKTARIDGFAQVFEKPEHPYLLKSIATEFYLMEMTAPVEMTCKVYKLDEVPAYNDEGQVTLPMVPGELIATGRAILSPNKIDTTYQNNDQFVVFELFGEENGDLFEIDPTVDYPIMVVFDGYNDPEMADLVDFTAVISRDIHSDEGHGETAYLLMEEADENFEFHGDYVWHGLNNFFTSGEMKTGFEVYLDIDLPFLVTTAGGNIFKDDEYTFSDEGGEMIRTLQLSEDTPPFDHEGIQFYSWTMSGEGDWTITWDGKDDLPDWLEIQLVDGEENIYTFDDGSTLTLGIDVMAQVTADPLPASVSYREATIRFEIPGEYLYYTFKQGYYIALKGDLNGDDEVSVADINVLIHVIAGDNVADSIIARCDINDDGEISVADINALINILLNF